MSKMPLGRCRLYTKLCRKISKIKQNLKKKEFYCGELFKILNNLKVEYVETV